MKNYFLLLTLLCLSLSARAHDAEVDKIFYNLNAVNRTATVTFKGDDPYGSKYHGDVKIPEKVTYNGTTYSVTSLGSNCFYGCSSLTSITIPNSVTSLGVECFHGCSSLTVIKLPNSVTSLGKNCFRGCSSLLSITIPNSVTSLGSYCFADCSRLLFITIPNSVTSLGERSFYGCSSLSSITIGNSVTSLGEWCFDDCSSLTSITIPNSVTSLGEFCFAGCSSLTSITLGNSVTSLGDDCFSGCRSLTSITIPNSVTSLGQGCFSGCRSLTSITIPNSVTSLGRYCFGSCSSLTSITIPNSVTSLGDCCFEGCSSLERMVVDAANPVYDSREDCNAIIHTSTNELIAGCKNSQIPNSVTSLGGYCFYNCYSLTSITIPNSVTSLGRYCFDGCSSLTSITIPNSVTSLGNDCFSGCSSLERMVVDAANPVYDSREDCNAIIHTSTNELIAGCKNSQIPNSVTSLGYGCFRGCSSLTSITIPNSVTSLGRFCFYGCSSLTAITIPNSVTSLGEACFFGGCSSLTSITIPNSVTSLGRYCFAGCSSLTSIYMLPSTPPSTGEYIFYNTPLETVYVVDEDAKTAYQTQEPWSNYGFVVMPYNVSWKVNGEPYAIGNPSTSVKGGQSVTVLPTEPDAIGTKVFVGWTDAEIAATQSTAPAVLFTTPEDAPAVTGNVTYYAVFAVATGGEVWEEISTAPEPGTYAILSDSHFMKAKITIGNRFAHGATPEISDATPATLTTAPASDCIWEITKPDDYYRMANGSQYAGGTSEKNKGALLDDASDDLAKWTIEHNGSQFSVINYGRSIASVDNAYKYLRENATNGWACYTSDTGSAPRLFKKTTTMVLTDYCTTIPDVQLSVGATGYATLYYSNYDLVVPANTEAYTYRSVNGALAESETYAEGAVIPAGEAVVVYTNNAVPCTLNFMKGIATVDCDTNNQLAGTDEETVIAPDADYYFYGLSLNSSNDINSVGFYWMEADGAAFTNGAHEAYLKIKKSEFAGTQPVRGFAFNGTTTGVESVESSNNAPQAIYDLTGRRVSKAEKGIYIINGKKVIK